MVTSLRLYRYTENKTSLLKRMKKIEGQAKGIQNMITQDRYCLEIVQQLSGMTSAADEVSLLILQSHIEGCVANAVREKRGEEQIRELMSAIRKVLKH